MSTPAAETSIRHEIVVQAPIARAFMDRYHVLTRHRELS